jgi:hypothetical protein
VPMSLSMASVIPSLLPIEPWNTRSHVFLCYNT